jgi:hypothetical protein
MVRMAMMATVALAADHPTLPTMWTATVNEDMVGIVMESESFVWRGESVENPSAKWTNFTDGSCQRLIISNGNFQESGRYLLGCDAVNCCYEDDGGSGPIEYQIPNIHPAYLASVTNEGKETITTFDGTDLAETVEADVWQWGNLVHYRVHTTPTDDPNVAKLHKWTVKAGDEFPNEYKDFRAIPTEEQESFLQQFRIPDVCQGHILDCDSARKQGLLSEKNHRFLKNGQTFQQRLSQAQISV